MRERTHVARALHVVLAAERINADAGPADISGRHREIRDSEDHRAALAMLGDAEPVVNRTVGRARIHPSIGANFVCRYALDFLDSLGRVSLFGNELFSHFYFVR